jgi:HlyD family type I secretion membrane fusion protein
METKNLWSPRKQIITGAVATLFGIGAFGAWAAVTEINGAVVAGGLIQVAERRQQIQHPFGGVVSEIAVKDGQRVRAGDMIIRLDDTELKAQAALLTRAIFEAQARLDRLSTEVLTKDTLVFRDQLLRQAAAEPALKSVLDDERSLYETRRDGVLQTTKQLIERKSQTEAVIGGRERQLEASKAQLALINDELAGAESLLKKKLIEVTRVSALRREAARLLGTIGELEAGIAEARSSIAGYEIEKLRYLSQWSEAAQGELRTLQPKEAESRERLTVIETQLKRLSLAAPMDGVVYGMKVFTIGGVVPAGGEIAAIIPDDAKLVFTVRVDPTQVDRLVVGERAIVKFPSFNAHTTPELEGELKYISADVLSDPNTGQSYYTAEVVLKPGAIEKLGNKVLIPGMPVETFIQTGARSPLSFIVKPFTDYIDYAFREE